MEAYHIPPVIPSGMEKGIQAWEQQRRPEILEAFTREVYGRSPGEGAYQTSWETLSKGDGKTIRLTIKAPYGTFSFPFVLKLPKDKNPHPAVIFICNRDREHIGLEDAGSNDFWPADLIVGRGYAAAAFFTEDVDTDQDDGFANGIIRCFEPDLQRRPDDAWATIAAWAFGASRIVDYLEQDPDIDRGKISVAGHSRGGKTALWAAAQDPRFSCAYSNCSGCSGAAVARVTKGERIGDINRGFPYWFCRNYKKYNGREDTFPVDQHMLLAMLAPRLLYVASATEDAWADPSAEFLSARLASQVYEEIYHVPGLACDTMPAPEQPCHKGNIGYHLRSGGHALTRYDWNCYLDFLDGKYERG